jgi:hypothetical protein
VRGRPRRRSVPGGWERRRDRSGASSARSASRPRDRHAEDGQRAPGSAVACRGALVGYGQSIGTHQSCGASGACVVVNSRTAITSLPRPVPPARLGDEMPSDAGPEHEATGNHEQREPTAAGCSVPARCAKTSIVATKPSDSACMMA